MIFERLARIPGIKAACAAAVVIALFGSGTVAAHAYWSAGVAMNSTVTAATFGMSAGNFSALNTTYMYAAAATSPIVIKPITVSNTGSAPLTFTLAVTNSNASLAPNITLWLWTTGSSNCGSTPQNVPGTVAAPPVMPSGAASAGGNSSITLCVATQLSGALAASQGQSVVATFTLTGRVGTSSWVSSAVSTATQSVYLIAAPTPTCAQTAQQGQRAGYVTLSWPVVTGATGYQVFVDVPGAPLSTTPVFTLTIADPPTFTVNVTGGDVTISADSNIRITSIDSVYGSSQAANVPIYYQEPFVHGNLRPASTSCTP